MKLYLVQQQCLDSNTGVKSIGLYQNKWKAEYIAIENEGFVEEFSLNQYPFERKFFEEKKPLEFEFIEFKPTNNVGRMEFCDE
jgi:hypothetical protein